MFLKSEEANLCTNCVNTAKLLQLIAEISSL